jgi:CRP-like cAMP-binding protein
MGYMILIMSKIPLAEQASLQEDRMLAGLDSGLLSDAQVLSAAAGSALFRAGEKPSRIFYVRTGEALMQRMTSSGSQVILQRASRAFLAEASLTAARYHCDGICRTDCELVVFSVHAIREAIDNNRETRWAWINLLAAQARRQRACIERLALKTVRERLHHLVLTEGSANREYSLPGTRMELAAELGVTPEAIYRTLAALQSEGVLTMYGSTLKWNI